MTINLDEILRDAARWRKAVEMHENPYDEFFMCEAKSSSHYLEIGLVTSFVDDAIRKDIEQST